MKSDVQIRIASPDDSDAIAAVMREAFAEFESLYTPEAFAVTIPDSNKIRTRFAEGAIWVALKDETIVGTVSTVAQGEKLYIRSMAVSKAEQGLGIGQKLLDAIEEYATENRHENLFLYTTPFLSSAIRLYEQNGFERGEIETDKFFGTPWFEMKKNLN